MQRTNKILCCQLLAAFFLFTCGVASAQVHDPNLYPLDTDITHIKLDLSFNLDSSLVYGKAIVSAKPYQGTKNNITLDANGFTIHSVELLKANGTRQPLTYSYDTKKLKITLDRNYGGADTCRVIINYTAMPEDLRVGRDIPTSGDRGIYFIDMPDKSKQVWTQGATECNSSWMPTINSPREKFTQEFSITIPSEYVSLSNGLMTSTRENGNGTRTDTWKLDKAHSTYLSMLAVGKFTITKDQWQGMEVNYYMEATYAPLAKLIFGKTPEMLDFFSDKMGVAYPWPKYSQIVVRNFVSGAMENTTASLFFEKMNMSAGEYQDENYEDIIAHELFHHWFGNLVTAESWSNLALNESFGTYGEYLWIEYKYGRDEADRHALRDINYYFSSPANKKEDLIRYDYSEREELFDAVTYQKGGRIVHMLRKTVGDSVFFKSLNKYLTQYAYGSANIADLQQVFEKTSGQDLNWFFKQWFLAPGHPELNIQTSYDQGKKETVIRIKQKQNLKATPLYRLPMKVDIYASGKKERKEILLDSEDQTFRFKSEQEPDLVNVDAEKSLLAIKTENKTLKQYGFQYQQAPLFMDRYEAITALVKRMDEQVSRNVLSKALYDSSWAIRLLALEHIGYLTDIERTRVYIRVKELALTDARSLVRAEAITALRNHFGDQNSSAVYREALKDKAPSVIDALRGAL